MAGMGDRGVSVSVCIILLTVLLVLKIDTKPESKFVVFWDAFFSPVGEMHEIVFGSSNVCSDNHSIGCDRHLGTADLQVPDRSRGMGLRGLVISFRRVRPSLLPIEAIPTFDIN